MDIAVPSRFACLKIEDDDFRPTSSSKKKNENKSNKKQGSSASFSKAPSASNNTTNKKGNEKSKMPSKKTKKQKEEVDKDWDEWQKKDAKFVNEVFEQQVESAILQSKLEFEQQKKNSTSKLETDTSQGKKKKTKTMSLDQFLETNKEPENKEEPKSKEFDKNFFQEVVETTKKVVNKEKVEQNRKKRQEAFEEVISLAQCQEKLEAERSKNADLTKELEEAKKEIALVKKRNTTLCSMLSQGEMKDKAEVLLELERLTLVKEELTEEVSRLYKLLEQERTKHHVTQNETHVKQSKEKIKKKKH